MKRFFDQQNIARYRRLATASTSDAERKLLLAVLASEEAEFKRDLVHGAPLDSKGACDGKVHLSLK